MYYDIKGYSMGTPCYIFVTETEAGWWYCVEGSCTVNLSSIEPIEECSIDTTDVYDIDCFTWDAPIDTLDDFITAVEY